MTGFRSWLPPPNRLKLRKQTLMSTVQKRAVKNSAAKLRSFSRYMRGLSLAFFLTAHGIAVSASETASKAIPPEPKESYWAFQTLVRPGVPPISDVSWKRSAKNPIDHFILAKLKEHGLSPSKEADRRTLIRRLYFDLIGLPPKPADVEEFIRDASKMPTRNSWIVCWLRRVTASAGRGTGWTWCITARRTDMTKTSLGRTRGPTAIM